MKELIEAYIGTGAKVTGYDAEVADGDLCYVVEIYNAAGRSTLHINNVDLLEFMWSRITNDNN